jgi:transcription antitermination factor NusG
MDTLDEHDLQSARWYAVYTRSRHEKKVYQQLVPKIEEVFLPLVRVWSRRKDRRTKYDKPLLPGYLFFREVLSPATRLSVLETFGVVRILSSKAGEQALPEPIPDEQMESLRILVAARREIRPCDYLSVGEEVEVVAGPFMGACGKLARINPRSNRLVVSIDLVNQAVAVDIDVADVKKVEG